MARSNRLNLTIGLLAAAALACGAFACTVNPAHAEEDADAAAYAKVQQQVCTSSDTIKVCNAKIVLLSRIIDKLHAVAPTAIIKGAFLAQNDAGTQVVCGYGWENNIPHDHATIRFGVRLHDDGESNAILLGTSAQVRSFGCGNAKAQLYYDGED